MVCFFGVDNRRLLFTKFWQTLRGHPRPSMHRRAACLLKTTPEGLPLEDRRSSLHSRTLLSKQAFSSCMRWIVRLECCPCSAQVRLKTTDRERWRETGDFCKGESHPNLDFFRVPTLDKHITKRRLCFSSKLKKKAVTMLGQESDSEKYRSNILRGAWRDRDTNDIFAHCSLISYFLDFKFSNFICLSELHPLIWFFFKNSFRKKKSIRKTTQNALAPSIFIVLSIVLTLGTPLLHTQAQNTLLQNFQFRFGSWDMNEKPPKTLLYPTRSALMKHNFFRRSKLKNLEQRIVALAQTKRIEKTVTKSEQKWRR